VTLQQLSQSGRIVKDLVEFGTRNHGERLVGWSEHRIRSGCVINHTSGGNREKIKSRYKIEEEEATFFFLLLLRIFFKGADCSSTVLVLFYYYILNLTGGVG